MSSLSAYLKEQAGIFKAIFFDIDGTLMLADSPIPGAAETIHELREAGEQVFFLTNNGGATHEQLARRLNRVGIEAAPEDFVTSSDPVPDYLRTLRLPEQTLFCVGRPFTIPGLVRCVKDPEEIESCTGILYAGGPHDWAANLEAIFNFLTRHPDAPVIVPNPDHLNPVGGKVTICPRGQLEMLRVLLAEVGKPFHCHYLGKPYPPIYEEALKRIHFQGPREERKHFLAVGDYLKSDIKGANQANFTSALILSGLSTRTEAEQAPEAERPALFFDSLRG